MKIVEQFLEEMKIKCAAKRIEMAKLELLHWDTTTHKLQTPERKQELINLIDNH